MRKTFAVIDEIMYRSKAASALLGISENTLRNYEKASGEVKRANTRSPTAPAIRIFTIEDVYRIARYRREQNLIKKVSGPYVISVAINKGGTGKSTSAAEIGVQLSLEGYRTLIIDLDVQSNLSQLLGYESDYTVDEAQDNGLTDEAIVTHTFKDVMVGYCDVRNGRTKTLEDVSHCIKRPFGEDGPAVIAADADVDVLDMTLAFDRGNRDLIFRDFFQDSRAGKVLGLNINDYDFVVIDCPPSINFSTTNAIASSDYVIAPIKLDSFGVKGMTRLMEALMGLNKRSPEVRPNLVILPTHLEKNVARIPRMQQRLQVYKEFIAPVGISRSELFPKTQENYLPLTLQMPTSAPALEYRQVTEYLVQSILKKEASLKAVA